MFLVMIIFVSCSEKTGQYACALSVIPDKPVQSAQANQGQHFPPKLDFCYKETLFKRKMS